ncbi:MAG: cytochrome c-550 PedF [Comamonadaceae bacterium CG_4_10_14_0_8_um_filter_57_29]|nr:MAG: cytochrome c-550 PedF [Comamonadaceae bacterium CG_4_10_14_0_8_um_filter_57_29]
MKFKTSLLGGCLLLGAVALAPMHVMAHGDVTPQAVDVSSLPPLGEERRAENPYRGLAEAAKVGASAYTQNCARCHGLEAVSGGMSPDLRELDAECTGQADAAKQAVCFKEVDDYFMSITLKGVVRNDKVYMPAFKGVFSQEAVWAVKAYLETRRVTE